MREPNSIVDDKRNISSLDSSKSIELPSHSPPSNNVMKHGAPTTSSNPSHIPNTLASPLKDWIQNILPSFPTVHASSDANKNSKLLSHVRMEHLLAGVSGGVASTLILHPLDLVKIRFAVNDGLSSRPKYNGLSHAFSSIFHAEGVRGLYR